MKTITILSLAAALTGIVSADTPAATTAPAAPAPAAAPAAQTPAATLTPAAKTGATKEQAETLLKEMMTNLGDLSKILETVTDKASADAAAPKVVEMSAKIKDLQLRSEKMGEPSPEVQQELMQQYGKQLEESVGKFMQASMKVGMAQFYGSDALSKAFQNMGAAMSGGQDDEESASDEAAPASTPAAQ